MLRIQQVVLEFDLKENYPIVDNPDIWVIESHIEDSYLKSSSISAPLPAWNFISFRLFMFILALKIAIHKSYEMELSFLSTCDQNEYSISIGMNFHRVVQEWQEFTGSRLLDFLDIYGGALLGVRSPSGLSFHDWETTELIRRIEIQPKNVGIFTGWLFSGFHRSKCWDVRGSTRMCVCMFVWLFSAMYSYV